MGLEYNSNPEGLERIRPEGGQLTAVETLPKAECTEPQASAVELSEGTEPRTLISESLEKMEKIRLFGKTECLNDAKVTDEIAEYLSGVEDLKFENWKKLTVEERTELLNRIETKIAKIEHRPPLPIKVEKMKPWTFGYQDNANKLIALNSLFVMSDTKKAYSEVIDTILHEGRHAYQHYNVDKKCVHDSLSEVNTWRENFYDPKYKYYSGSSLVVVIGPKKVGDVGYRLYYYQPVEIDARNFAADVMLKLKKKGFMS